VHGTALAAGTSGRFAVDFGQHRFQVAALGQVMGVGAMAAEHIVVGGKGCTGADRRRLLADAQVDRAAHLLLRIQIDDPFLDPADAEHIV
jgi:hypothetical protein